MWEMLRGNRVELSDPPPIRWLFANTSAGLLWLVVRLYVGWQFLEAGLEKARGTGWLNNNGSALEGFWQRIVQVPAQGKPPITYDWYREFIQMLLSSHSVVWFAKLIVFGEIAIGIALILGLLTGLAAFGGIFLNFNFMLAGSASTNPVLFLLGALLLLAWKVAGWIGVDHWLLPLLGTPWEPHFFRGSRGGTRSRSRPR
jgi:thiosulfate dehydrogenase (quinone) large subunit